MNKIKVARAIKGMTMQDLAKKYGYSKSYISRIENGERKCPKKIEEFVEATLNQVSD